jgi:titin
VAIDITGAQASNNTLELNLIGTPDGVSQWPNSYGVRVETGNNTVGGAGAGNVISGNYVLGVSLTSAGNQVLGNFIGTTADGSHVLANGRGVEVGAGASNNTIGAAGAGNVISGNAGYGISITGSGATGNQVLANFIGTNADGSPYLGNGGGVLLAGGAGGNQIGAAGAGNVISGNYFAGVFVQNASANLVQANFIGTDATGKKAIPNDPFSNYFDGVDLMDGAVNNTVGGSRLLGLGNVISGNGADGVFIGDYFTANDPATGNMIQGNLIGTDVTGTAALPNDQNGVHLDSGARNNTVGGTTPDLGNLISANGGSAVGNSAKCSSAAGD